MTLELLRVTPEIQREVAAWGAPDAPWQGFEMGEPPVSPEFSWYAAVDDGRVVGQFALRHAPSYAPYWWLQHFYVPPRYRGRGYGRSILSGIYEMFPDRNLAGEVVAWNTYALRLYLGMGWVVSDTYWRDIDVWEEVDALLEASTDWRRRAEPHLRFEGWRWSYRAHEICYWPSVARPTAGLYVRRTGGRGD